MKMKKKIKRGFRHTEKTKRKISKTLKGRKLSEEHKRRLSEFRKGKPSGMLGKHLSEEHKKNIGLGNIGHWALRGKDCHLWKGGISFSPYSVDWTETLRRSIRERDNYTCQLCNKIQSDRAHSVHHIDYDKKNCSPKNLITLCVSCNTKVNSNRYHWTEYFNQILKV